MGSKYDMLSNIALVSIRLDNGVLSSWYELHPALALGDETGELRTYYGSMMCSQCRGIHHICRNTTVFAARGNVKTPQ